MNKGTAFSREERLALGLEALLPYQVETLEQQVQRAWEAFTELADPLQRFAFATALRQSNLILFHRFLEEHIEAVLPIVYTPTVGAAIQHFSATYRTPSQGIYLAAPDQNRLRELLAQVSPDPPDLLLVTDSEGILGIGDQGIGGIHICQGKLAVYTLCAGLHPERALPVVLDVGTDRASLLEDPLYPGWRHRRLRGDDYDAFIAAFVASVEELFPHTFLHWEDFGTANAQRNLDLYRQRLASFNDDIQGTSGVASAAVMAASAGLGQTLSQQRIVIFGAGTAGCGIAQRLARLLQREGLGAEEAHRRIWLIDRQGLLHGGLSELSDVQRPFARSHGELAAFGTAEGEPIGLEAVVRGVKPSVLIGTSTVAGAFTRSVVEAMAAGVERPILLPLSNPTPLAEIRPVDALAWSGGRALVATGSPFEPVPLATGVRTIGQCNNCFLFPGLGQACVAVGARQVSEEMIDAGLGALAREIPAANDPEAPLMPGLKDVQRVSRAVAEAVAFAAVDQGLARLASSHAEAIACLDAATWRARYRSIEAI